jgi:hypothetical protein
MVALPPSNSLAVGAGVYSVNSSDLLTAAVMEALLELGQTVTVYVHAFETSAIRVLPANEFRGLTSTYFSTTATGGYFCLAPTATQPSSVALARDSGILEISVLMAGGSHSNTNIYGSVYYDRSSDVTASAVHAGLVPVLQRGTVPAPGDDDCLCRLWRLREWAAVAKL